jgi:hypothetical protein
VAASTTFGLTSTGSGVTPGNFNDADRDGAGDGGQNTGDGANGRVIVVLQIF